MFRLSPAWVALFGVAAWCVPAQAQVNWPDPVNTTASVSAGAADDLTPSGTAASNSGDSFVGHPEGTYTGVVPGSGATVSVSVPPGKTPGTITWPGFQMRPDGTSRVFVQSTSALPAQPSTAPGKYLVFLPGARVHGETNRLPLDTRYFNTPVSKISLEQQRDGVMVSLDLRSDVTPRLSSEQADSGYYFIFIDFPKGQYIAPPPPEQVQAEASPPVAKATPTRSHMSNPADLTTYLDVQGNASSSAMVDDEKPPSFKGHLQASGRIKLGR